VLATALAEQGRYSEAFTQLDSLDASAPGDPTTRDLRAQLQRRSAAGARR
jgi:hypothetical protein